jgi:hypothetical protein
MNYVLHHAINDEEFIHISPAGRNASVDIAPPI